MINRLDIACMDWRRVRRTPKSYHYGFATSTIVFGSLSFVAAVFALDVTAFPKQD
jgi:hypothetical protein